MSRRRHDETPTQATPWGDRSVIFRRAVASGWDPVLRPGTPAEWDKEMQRAYGPGVSVEDIVQAALAVTRQVHPQVAFDALVARWKGGGQ